MISSKIEAALNRQIDLEGYSSMYYLAMASWCEVKGYNGIANFLYNHSDEERMHMLKLFKYINDRGGHALGSRPGCPAEGIHLGSPNFRNYPFPRGQGV